MIGITEATAGVVLCLLTGSHGRQRATRAHRCVSAFGDCPGGPCGKLLGPAGRLARSDTKRRRAGAPAPLSRRTVPQKSHRPPRSRRRPSPGRPARGRVGRRGRTGPGEWYARPRDERSQASRCRSCGRCRRDYPAEGRIRTSWRVSTRRGGDPRGCRRQLHRAAVRGRRGRGPGLRARPWRRGAVPDWPCELRAVAGRLKTVDAALMSLPRRLRDRVAWGRRRISCV